MKLSYGMALSIACALVTSSDCQAAVLFGDIQDGIINNSSVPVAGEAASTVIKTGRTVSGNDKKRNGYIVFDLSSETAPIQSATLEVFYTGFSDGTPSVNLDLWAVGYGNSATDEPAGLVYIVDDTDATAGNVKLADDLIDSGSLPASGQYLSVSGTDLVTFLNNRGSNNFVFFRLNPDANISSSAAFTYNFSSADEARTAQDPRLTLTSIPEPASFLLVGLGGLLIAGRHRR